MAQGMEHERIQEEIAINGAAPPTALINEATWAFIRQHTDADTRALALRPAPAGVDLPRALEQIEGWQTARQKLPRWAATRGVVFPPRLSMEQCSSEPTATYKVQVATRLLGQLPDAGRTHVMADLTGGFGIDFSSLAPLFRQALYIERNPHLCTLATHNFRCMGLHQAQVLQADSTAALPDVPAADLIYADPARRDRAGRKTVEIADCEPDLTHLLPTLCQRAHYMMVKLSPMLDIHQAIAALPHIIQVHAVSVGGECKELLLVASAQHQQPLTYHCANILPTRSEVFCFTPQEEHDAPCTLATTPQAYLYEPNASVLKCGGFRSVGARYGVQKLHPHSHLYTSAQEHKDFPGRTFRVLRSCGFSKKELKEALHDLPAANLTLRNFPGTVDALRKRLRLKEGGSHYLFATTQADGKHLIIICEKVG